MLDLLNKDYQGLNNTTDTHVINDRVCIVIYWHNGFLHKNTFIQTKWNDNILKYVQNITMWKIWALLSISSQYFFFSLVQEGSD